VFGATVLFGWYLNHFDEYSELYGPIALGIALLIWMFLISLIVLVGAEFNLRTQREWLLQARTTSAV
jgi:membrane protein